MAGSRASSSAAGQDVLLSNLAGGDISCRGKWKLLLFRSTRETVWQARLDLSNRFRHLGERSLSHFNRTQRLREVLNAYYCNHVVVGSLYSHSISHLVTCLSYIS